MRFDMGENSPKIKYEQAIVYACLLYIEQSFLCEMY